MGVRTRAAQPHRAGRAPRSHSGRAPGETASGASTALRVTAGGASAVILIWSVAMIFGQDIDPAKSAAGIARFGSPGTTQENPLTLDDYLFMSVRGRSMAKRQADGDNILIDQANSGTARIPPRAGQGVIVYLAGVGVQSVSAGTDVWIVDQHGLGDPLASRLDQKSGFIAGHEKIMPFLFAQARFAPATTSDGPNVAVARHALSCGPVAGAHLLRIVTRPTGDPVTRRSGRRPH